MTIIACVTNFIRKSTLLFYPLGSVLTSNIEKSLVTVYMDEFSRNSPNDYNVLFYSCNSIIQIISQMCNIIQEIPLTTYPN